MSFFKILKDKAISNVSNVTNTLNQSRWSFSPSITNASPCLNYQDESSFCAFNIPFSDVYVVEPEAQGNGGCRSIISDLYYSDTEEYGDNTQVFIDKYCNNDSEDGSDDDCGNLQGACYNSMLGTLTESHSEEEQEEGHQGCSKYQIQRVWFSCKILL